MIDLTNVSEIKNVLSNKVIDKIEDTLGNIIYEAYKKLTGIPPFTIISKGQPLKDYKIYGESKQRNLPQGYTEVEYIEGNNSGYIPTDIYLDGSDTVKIKMKTPDTGVTTCWIFGSHTSGASDNFSLYSTGTASLAFWRYGASSYRAQKFGNDTLYEIEINYNSIKVNETTYSPGFTESTFTTSSPIYIGDIKASSSAKLRGKLYYFEVVGKAKLYPCVRNSDSQVGLYNINNNTFYPVEGTMAAGNSIVPTSVGDILLPSEYQEVEYIVGDNNGYISTDLYLTGNDTLKLKIDTTGFDTSCSVIGSYSGTSSGPNYSIYFSRSANAYVRYGDITSRPFRAYADNLYDVVMTPTGISVNGDIKDTWEAETFTTTDVMLIGSMTGSSTTSFQGKIYSCEVVGRAKFIPCYKKSDNTVGMYDIVRGIFYPATGSLTVGNDKNTYKIPVTVSNDNNSIVTNIYLDEPLRKVGNYADYIDYEEQKVYRNVIVNDDSGALPIDQSYSGTTDATGESVVLPQIPTYVGTTTISVGTQVQPSNMYIKYKGK